MYIVRTIYSLYDTDLFPYLVGGDLLLDRLPFLGGGGDRLTDREETDRLLFLGDRLLEKTDRD